jgi:hypothetical protein
MSSPSTRISSIWRPVAVGYLFAQGASDSKYQSRDPWPSRWRILMNSRGSMARDYSPLRPSCIPFYKMRNLLYYICKVTYVEPIHLAEPKGHRPHKALRSRSRRRPRPRIRPRGVMECGSVGVLRQVGIAPRDREVCHLNACLFRACREA